MPTGALFSKSSYLMKLMRNIMARLVHCKKLGTEEEGLESIPFPGPKGQYIYDHISQKAWQEWIILIALE
jgi:hypothetical protein